MIDTRYVAGSSPAMPPCGYVAQLVEQSSLLPANKNGTDSSYFIL